MSERRAAVHWHVRACVCVCAHAGVCVRVRARRGMRCKPRYGERERTALVFESTVLLCANCKRAQHSMLQLVLESDCRVRGCTVPLRRADGRRVHHREHRRRHCKPRYQHAPVTTRLGPTHPLCMHALSRSRAYIHNCFPCTRSIAAACGEGIRNVQQCRHRFNEQMDGICSWLKQRDFAPNLAFKYP